MRKTLIAALFVAACGGGGSSQSTTPTPLPENTGGATGGDAYGGDAYGGGDFGGGGDQRMAAPICPPAPEPTGELSEAEEMRRAENIVVALEQMAKVAQAHKGDPSANPPREADCGAMYTQVEQTIRANCTAFSEAKAMKSESPELEARYKGRVEAAVGLLMEPMMACPQVGELMGSAMQ